MAIINQSTVVLILIISYSVGLDLFGRSKIDTQETSLNIVSVSSLLTFEKSPPEHYLISRIIYLLIMFFWYETQRDMRQLLWMGASFYYLKMPFNLIQYCGTVGTFNTRKSIFQRSRKTFSFLNYAKYQQFPELFPKYFHLVCFSISGIKI